MPEPSRVARPRRSATSTIFRFRRRWRRALVAALMINQLAAPWAVADEPLAPIDADDQSALTFLDEVTILATRGERVVRDLPGTVDILGVDSIQERGATQIGDLVRYLPGVEIDGDPSRLGANGFVIRGIGGNRVRTEIDGVPTAEQFDFGPFSVHQFAIDPDTLESVEVVRSAGSALYGSDALGGIVALTTRRPRSYLGDGKRHLNTRLGWDDRSREAALSGTIAFGGDLVQGSLSASRRQGHELDNQGTVDSQDATRTTPNPMDRRQHNALLQVSVVPATSSEWLVAFEVFATEAETELLSARHAGSPFSSPVLDADGDDTQDRSRLSISQTLRREVAAFDTSRWRVFLQTSDTEQQTVEWRQPAVGLSRRDGWLGFEQQTLGLDVELRKALGTRDLLTYGVVVQRDRFDQRRDREEHVVATGQPVATPLVFPTKYFPRSETTELGVFAQAEVELLGGRLSLVPGVRFDRYALDADQDDAVFLAGNPGAPTPVDLDVEALSPKLGAVLSITDEVSVFAQWARGFRAPPMSSVNNGFTNLGGGYRTLPNPDLEPETSDNAELGFRLATQRLSLSLTGFANRFDDFIDTVALGFDPRTRLIEFQPRNVDAVEISGIELAAEWRPSVSWTVRAAASATEARDRNADQPLASIAPAQGVLGCRYRSPDHGWGAELLATATAAKSADALPSDSRQFRAPSQQVVDLTAWWTVSQRVSLQLSVWNLTDTKAWSWPWVQGQHQDSPILDRFTSPGRRAGLQVRYVF